MNLLTRTLKADIQNGNSRYPKMDAYLLELALEIKVIAEQKRQNALQLLKKAELVSSKEEKNLYLLRAKKAYLEIDSIVRQLNNARKTGIAPTVPRTWFEV